MKRIISITTGTRADYGFLRPILKEISKNKAFDYHLIVTGMHLLNKFGLSLKEIQKDGFKIGTKIKSKYEGNSSLTKSKLVGDYIISFSKSLHKVKPDINLVFGDRDEQLSSAIAAYHLNIPNVHLHGGDISGGIDEYNRHAMTKISNIHFAATKKSYNRIIKMGENPKKVFLTGSTGIDEISNLKIPKKSELEKKYNIKISGKEIILLYHPVTTQIKSINQEITTILKAIKKTKNQTFIIVPNSDAGHELILKNINQFKKKNYLMRFYKTIRREDFLSMLANFGVLIGNSSSGFIEASYFDIPVINIGIRQTQREKGKNIIDLPNPSIKMICDSINFSLKKEKHKKLSKNNVYGNGNAAKSIVKLLQRISFNDELIQKKFY